MSLDIDIAGQLTKLVTLLEGHPVASVFSVLAIILILGAQKEGLFSKFLSYLEARENREASKEERRIEILHMIENRSQLLLPGMESKKKEKEK